jgi:membrane protease YdiL (CAAX protease family)
VSPLQCARAKWRAVLESILVLYLYGVLVTVFLILPPLMLRSQGIRLGLRPGTAITLGGVLIAELVALGATMAYYRRKGITLGQLGWSMPRNTGAVIALSLAVALLYSGFTLRIPQIKENITEISLLKLWGVFVGILAALMEEVIFRGYIMARLQQVRISPLVQVLFTSVAFALLHLGFGFVGILCTLVVGVALGGLYLLGQRNLLGPALCHSGINAVVEPWLLLWLLQFYSERFG